MEYQVAKPGRIIVVHLVEGDHIYDCIEGVAKTEGVRAAAVLITGGIRRADVVVGPKQEKPSLIGDFQHFEGPGESLGVGTIYCDEEGPKMHLHATIGKRDGMIVGCPRGGASVFLILEVTIIEILDTTAERKFDPEHGVKLLSVK